MAADALQWVLHLPHGYRIHRSVGTDHLQLHRNVAERWTGNALTYLGLKLMESTMKKLLVRLVLVGECPLTFLWMCLSVAFCLWEKPGQQKQPCGVTAAAAWSCLSLSPCSLVIATITPCSRWFIPSLSPLRQRILLHSSAPHSSAVTCECTPRNWLLVTICTFLGSLHRFGVTSTSSFRFGSRKTPFWVFGVLFSLMVPPSLHALSYANYFAAHSHRVLALDPTSKWSDFWATQQP